jgi:hypothetical protein
MNIALIILGTLLAGGSIGSAIAKFKKVPDIMTTMAAVGVKTNLIPVLASLEVAGGLGVIAGIWIPSLGVLASACLALYFLGAFGAHLRKKHKVVEFGAALGFLVIAIAVTVLQSNR